MLYLSIAWVLGSFSYIQAQTRVFIPVDIPVIIGGQEARLPPLYSEKGLEKLCRDQGLGQVLKTESKRSNQFGLYAILNDQNELDRSYFQEVCINPKTGFFFNRHHRSSESGFDPKEWIVEKVSGTLWTTPEKLLTAIWCSLPEAQPIPDLPEAPIQKEQANDVLEIQEPRAFQFPSAKTLNSLAPLNKIAIVIDKLSLVEGPSQKAREFRENFFQNHLEPFLASLGSNTAFVVIEAGFRGASWEGQTEVLSAYSRASDISETYAKEVAQIESQYQNERNSLWELSSQYHRSQSDHTLVDNGSPLSDLGDAIASKKGATPLQVINYPSWMNNHSLDQLEAWKTKYERALNGKHVLVNFIRSGYYQDFVTTSELLTTHLYDLLGSPNHLFVFTDGNSSFTSYLKPRPYDTQPFFLHVVGVAVKNCETCEVNLPKNEKLLKEIARQNPGGGKYYRLEQK